jgi:hypothetical protein
MQAAKNEIGQPIPSREGLADSVRSFRFVPILVPD